MELFIHHLSMALLKVKEMVDILRILQKRCLKSLQDRFLDYR